MGREQVRVVVTHQPVAVTKPEDRCNLLKGHRDAVFAWSEVLAKSALPGRSDVGALRLRTVATADRPCHDFPYKNGEEFDPAVLLELDYWALIPR